MMEPCALTTATALQVHSGLRAGLRTRRKGRLRAGLEAGLRMRRKARGRACAPGTRGRACAPQSQASHAALNAAAGGGDSISRHLRRQPCARPWCPLGPTHGAMLHPTNPCQCRPMQHLMFFSSMSTMASSAGVSGRTCGGAERNMERSPISWPGGALLGGPRRHACNAAAAAATSALQRPTALHGAVCAGCDLAGSPRRPTLDEAHNWNRSEQRRLPALPAQNATAFQRKKPVQTNRDDGALDEAVVLGIDAHHTHQTLNQRPRLTEMTEPLMKPTAWMDASASSPRSSMWS